MKGIVIVSPFWTKFFSLGKARGVTIFPFIFLLLKSDRENEVLINHERIHIYQALEMLVIPFYIWYLVEFVIGYIRYKNWNRAYRSISFEKEAYANEMNLDYLSERSFWSFMKY